MFQVGSYGGKLKYTISYVAGPRGTVLDDSDIQITVSLSSLLICCFLPWVCVCSVYSRLNGGPQGNDITLVAHQPWQRRQQGSRETQRFEVVFKEVNVQ